MNSITTRISTLGLCTLLAGSLQADPKLEAEKYSSPGLQGYFGSPVLGNPSTIASSRVIWHPNGKIFTRVLPLDRPNVHARLCMWEADAQTQQVQLRALLNVSGAWCLSHRGDVLCSQSRRGDDGSKLKDVPAWVASDFGCFRMADGVRLWSLPVRRDETIVGSAFTLEDAGVAVLSIHARQMTLRLLDARDGRELRRHDFDLPEEREFREDHLMMRKDAVWLRRKVEEDYRWVAFPLATFNPEPVKMDVLEEEGMREVYFQTSPDGRWLAACHNTRYVICQLNGSKWVIKDSGHALKVNSSGHAEDGFYDVQFLPDNRRAVIFQRNQIRVIELSSARELAKVERCFSAGRAVSPDGKRLLVTGHGGFEILSADTLKPAGTLPRHQHVMPPVWLRFLGDGSTLASAAAEGVWLWDVASRKPRAHLRASAPYCPEYALNTPALAEGGLALVADEGTNYVTWKLPDLSGAVPDVPLVVAAQPAFGMPSLSPAGEWGNSLFADPEGKSFITIQQSGVVLRQGLGADASKTLSNQPPTYVRITQGFLDRPGNRFVYADRQKDAWNAMDLETGKMTSITEGGRGLSILAPARPGAPPATSQKRTSLAPLMALPATGLSLGLTLDGHLCLTNFEGTTFTRWLDPAPQGTKVQGKDVIALSPDEKRFATLLSESEFHRQSIGVWELDTGRLLAAWPVPASGVRSLAFSPDNSLLACGHDHGSISLWKLADLILEQERKGPANPTGAGATSAPAPARPAGSPSAKAPAQPPGSVPLSKERRIMHLHATSWAFQEDGRVTKTEFPDTGRLSVNGQAFEASGFALTPSPYLTDFFDVQQGVESDKPGQTRFKTEDKGKINGGIISQSEGRAGQVWVSRQTGVPAGHGSLVFTDSFTNTGTESQQAVIEWDAVFPAGTAGLMDSSFKPVQIGDNGVVTPAPDACWIAGLVGKETAAAVPVIAFRSESSGHIPGLVWVPDECRLKVRHLMTLPPGETRHLAHGVSLIGRAAGTAPEIFTDPHWRDFSLWVPYSVRSRGGNFGVDMDHEPAAAHGGRGQRGSDPLGLPWDVQRDGSFYGGLGASAVLQLWMDDAPLGYAGGHLFDCQTSQQVNGHTSPRPWQTVYGRSADRKLLATRWIHKRTKFGNLLMDTIRNGHNEPVKARIRLVSTFSEPIKALYSGAGKEMPMTVGEALEYADGSLVVEVSGETRPATWIGFHQQGADLKPELRLMTPQMISMDYELELAPNAQVALYHWTTQRPITSFGSLDLAFADCLPFSREGSARLVGKSNVK
ncbi:hypothetical protein WJU23_02025 [Prosthecobacter sp. SYSU 5D2]|uniref:WD40 repeat domain-containing protein n=1 Tax=Prosthecobacter sp. SYSU 5D2 TaxID=3134134 RepID=UPI0031FEB85D